MPESGARKPGAPGPDRWFFDGWSQVYDLPPVQWATYRPLHDAVVQALEIVRPARVLDVGCGTGLLATRLSEAHPDAAVVGCDFSAGMLRQAHAHHADGRWVRGDAGRLPVKSGVFDAVVSTEAFHWFPDQDAALTEFRRVLRPGGSLLLALVVVPFHFWSTLIHLGSRLVGEPFWWPTPEELTKRIEGAGLQIVRQRRVYRVPGGLLIPPLLTHAVRPAEDRPTSSEA